MRAFMAHKTFKIPVFDQQLPAKCSVFLFLFGAEHYQSLEIALTSVEWNDLKVGLFHIEFCNDRGHCFSWTVAIYRYDAIVSPTHQCGEYSITKQHFLSYIFILHNKFTLFFMT
jgi:hypothetical protein